MRGGVPSGEVYICQYEEGWSLMGGDMTNAVLEACIRPGSMRG